MRILHKIEWTCPLTDRCICQYYCSRCNFSIHTLIISSVTLGYLSSPSARQRSTTLLWSFSTLLKDKTNNLYFYKWQHKNLHIIWLLEQLSHTFRIFLSFCWKYFQYLFFMIHLVLSVKEVFLQLRQISGFYIKAGKSGEQFW